MKKAELAIQEGIRNIFLMSGTWVMTAPYREMPATHRERLAALAEDNE